MARLQIAEAQDGYRVLTVEAFILKNYLATSGNGWSCKSRTWL